jgi:hypothetical protein
MVVCKERGMLDHDLQLEVFAKRSAALKFALFSQARYRGWKTRIWYRDMIVRYEAAVKVLEKAWKDYEWTKVRWATLKIVRHRISSATLIQSKMREFQSALRVKMSQWIQRNAPRWPRFQKSSGGPEIPAKTLAHQHKSQGCARWPHRSGQQIGSTFCVQEVFRIKSHVYQNSLKVPLYYNNTSALAAITLEQLQLLTHLRLL